MEGAGHIRGKWGFPIPDTSSKYLKIVMAAKYRLMTASATVSRY